MSAQPDLIDSPARHLVVKTRVGFELVVSADSLPGLYAEAGRALTGLMGQPAGPGDLGTQHVASVGKTREALLLGWLNELLFHTEREKRLFTDFKIRDLSESGGLESRIRAELRGTEAVDWHIGPNDLAVNDVTVEESEERFEAHVQLSAA
jgi:SHS2 domain-containing protein